MKLESPEVGELWLAELSGLAGHVMHDLRNGLQGVAVNLEVIRSRVDGGTAPIAQLQPYATNAAREFEELSQRVEALSRLAREGQGSADVGETLDTLALLLGGRNRKSLLVEHDFGSAQVPLSHAATRLILTRLVLGAVRNGGIVKCFVRRGQHGTVQLKVEPAAGISLEGEVRRLAELLNVVIEMENNTLALSFPAMLVSDSVLA